jgi:hypothetical protein
VIQIFYLPFVFHLGLKMQLPAPVWKDVMSPAASTLADADSLDSEEKSPPPCPAYAAPVGVGGSAPNETRYVTPPRPTQSVKLEHEKRDFERSDSTVSTAPTELYPKRGDSDTSTPTETAARRLNLTAGSGDSELGGQENVPDPIPGQLRISQQALDARMRRMMKPTAYGTSKVPDAPIGMWKMKGKERKSLEKLFQSIGFDKVCHAKTLELVHLEKWFVLNRSLFYFCLTLLSLVLF